jgi:hypothetical protein
VMTSLQSELSREKTRLLGNKFASPGCKRSIADWPMSGN